MINNTYTSSAKVMSLHILKFSGENFLNFKVSDIENLQNCKKDEFRLNRHRNP